MYKTRSLNLNQNQQALVCLQKLLMRVFMIVPVNKDNNNDDNDDDDVYSTVHDIFRLIPQTIASTVTMTMLMMCVADLTRCR